MIYVVGSGGNGQTYFMQFLHDNGINTNILVDGRNNGGDNLKHLSNPKHLKPRMTKHDMYKGVKVEKCIFLYNHPYYSLLSHYRRKWAYAQCCKLGNPKSLTRRIVNNFDNFKKLTLRANKDIYGFVFQFKNWIDETRKNNLDILFLDFNDVLNERDRLNTFVGKELNYDSFTIKERSTSDTQHKKLYLIYDNLYNDMKRQINIRRRREALALSDPTAYEKKINHLCVQKKLVAKKKNTNKKDAGAGPTCGIKKSSCSGSGCCSR